jgi:hypothetical protein
MAGGVESEPCRLGVTSRDVRIARLSVESGAAYAAWSESQSTPHPNPDFPGTVFILQGPEAAEVRALLATVVASAAGAFPSRCDTQQGRDLALELVPFRLESWPEFESWGWSFIPVIRNCGDERVTVVRMGEGSVEGLRTPIFRLHVLRKGRELREVIPPSPEGRRINHPREWEIMDLAPSQAAIVGGGPGRSLSDLQGDYTVIGEYVNDPAMAWADMLMEPDPRIMQRIRDSTPCHLFSPAQVVRSQRRSRLGR